MKNIQFLGILRWTVKIILGWAPQGTIQDVILGMIHNLRGNISHLLGCIW